MILWIFAFASWSLLRPILDRFWFDFGSQNRSKIGPKKVPKGVGNHGRFCMPSGTFKNLFFGQHGPNLAPKTGPKSDKKSIPKAIKFGVAFEVDFPQFWSIFGPKRSQNGTEIGFKINVNLEKPICCHPYEKPMQKHENSRSGGSKNHKKIDKTTTKKWVQNRSAFGTHFSPTWADFGGQVGTQNR